MLLIFHRKTRIVNDWEGGGLQEFRLFDYSQQDTTAFVFFCAKNHILPHPRASTVFPIITYFNVCGVYKLKDQIAVQNERSKV